MEIIIRPYEKKDRLAVRQIAWDTAHGGNSAESIFFNRESAADLLTAYYTDYEPGALWVAEAGGAVVGYLSGCFHTHRYRLRIAWSVFPKAIFSLIFQRAFWRKQTASLIKAFVQTWKRGGFSNKNFVKNYPAHFHINIKQEFRGKNIGRSLVGKFIDQAKKAGNLGVHVRVRSDNMSACKFFESLGFLILARRALILPFADTFKTYDVTVYGRTL